MGFVETERNRIQLSLLWQQLWELSRSPWSALRNKQVLASSGGFWHHNQVATCCFVSGTWMAKKDEAHEVW